VLLAKDETVFQSIVEILFEVGRCYGMEINMEKLWQ
jgi:hypothetical protein